MNKYELCREVAKNIQRPLRQDVIPIINEMIEVMRCQLLDNQKITFNDFGSFFLQERKRRFYYDPTRQINRSLPLGMEIKFSPSPTLRSEVRHRYDRAVPEHQILVPEFAEP